MIERIERARQRVRDMRLGEVGLPITGNDANLAYIGALEWEVRDADEQLRGAVDRADEAERLLTAIYEGRAGQTALEIHGWLDRERGQ